MGKELHSVSKDLSSLVGGLDAIKNSHEKKSRGKDGAQQKALDTYLMSVKARRIESDLRTVIQQTQGMSGWLEFQKIRQQILKEEKAGRYNALKRKNELLNLVGIVVAILITGIGGYLMIEFAVSHK